MRKSKARSIIFLAMLCVAAAALVTAGLFAGYRARRIAVEMESFEWIHNDRCLEKMASLPEPEAGFRFFVLGDIQIGTA